MNAIQKKADNKREASLFFKKIIFLYIYYKQTLKH